MCWGDAAGLARHHVRLADGVEQARLAVVDVAEDGHDRRARDACVLVPRFLISDGRGDGAGGLLGGGGDAELGGDDGGRLVVDGVVHGGHDAVRHEALDRLDGGDAEALAQPLDGDRLGKRDGARTGRLSGCHASSAPLSGMVSKVPRRRPSRSPEFGDIRRALPMVAPPRARSPTGTVAAEVGAPTWEALPPAIRRRQRPRGSAPGARAPRLPATSRQAMQGALRLTTGDCHGGPQWIRPE